MSSNSDSLKYMFQKGRWIVSFNDNPGLCASMKSIGAELKHNRIQEQTKSYWFVSPESFDAIKPILIDSGYSEYETVSSKPASASFQLDSGPQKSEKSLNPKNNPFQYPEINVQNPQAANEFVQNHTFSVSELNKCINNGIDKIFPAFWLTGEIAGLNNKNGHLYFHLVEKVREKATEQTYNLDAVIWRFSLPKLLDKLRNADQREFQNGDKVRVLGKLNFYDVGGKISFVIQDIDTFYAEGEFIKQKQQIEAELTRQGIHDSNKQIPFPPLPLRLAIFSARGAAGMGDFEKTMAASGYPFKITLFTIALQGNNVERDFIKSYQMLEQIGIDRFDLALVMRGGGGVELGVFNNLNIALTIARSPLKFLIGIGHDKDRCVLDEIATRALTPTDAGKILVEICDELTRNLREQRDTIELCARRHLESYATNLSITTERFTNVVKRTCQKAETDLERQKSEIVRNTEKRLLNANHALTTQGQNLKNAAQQLTHQATMHLNSLENQVRNQANTLINNKHENLKLLSTRITDISRQNLNKYQQETENYHKLISAYNPDKWFERGFVLLSDKSGKAVTSIHSIAPKDTVNIRMKDGKATASIKAVTPDNNHIDNN